MPSNPDQQVPKFHGIGNHLDKKKNIIGYFKSTKKKKTQPNLHLHLEGVAVS